MPDAAIRLEGVCKRFAGRTVLDDVSLEVPEGAEVALLGPNGAGKTTLMSILSTLMRPDGGRALIAGADVVRQPVAARRGLGVVFQDASLDDRLTAAENLDFHGRVHGMPARARRAAATRLLALVELSTSADIIVRTFSGGMRRRLEIARALMHGPRILILDEPTVGLDVQTRLHIRAYLDRLRSEERLTVLTSTHHIEEVEAADRIVIIDHGRVIAKGSAAALKSAHAAARLLVTPRDAAAEASIRASNAVGATMPGGILAIEIPGPTFTGEFLARHGAALSAIRLEEPSLETVFLSLTGRALRDPDEPVAPSSRGRRT